MFHPYSVSDTQRHLALSPCQLSVSPRDALSERGRDVAIPTVVSIDLGIVSVWLPAGLCPSADFQLIGPRV